MYNAFRSHVEHRFPKLLQRKFLLACSGGIDSMVLTDLCARTDMDFAIAHCNFGLRGEESDSDEKFVGYRAVKIGKEFFVNRFDTKSYAKKHKVSIQMAARELRYAWFNKIMYENAIRTLITAHHADDNLETFLINLSRGTGIDGLTGIPEKTDTIARPLLSFSRSQIVAYAHAENIGWREDSSNVETKYLRNTIRRDMVPLLKKLNPNFLDNFRETQVFLAQTAEIANNHLEQLKKTIFTDGHTGITKIPIKELMDLKPRKGHLYGLLGEFGFTEWNDVENLLHAMSGKEVRSKTHRLIKDRDYLLLAEVPKVKDGMPSWSDTSPSKSNISSSSNNTSSMTSSHLTNLAAMFSLQTGGDGTRAFTEKGEFLIEKEQHSIKTPIKIDISEAESIGETGAHILYVSQKALKYPLTLRKWEKGDYFYPFGMRGKKKLSKFFKDEKIDVLSKQNQWLLCSGGDIVWIIGRRADERFKVLESTEKILKFELKPFKTDK